MRLASALVLALAACDEQSVPLDSGAPDAGPRPAFVASELADEAILARYADPYAALPLFAPGRFRQVSSEDRGLDPSVSTLLANGNRDFDYFVCLGTQHDVREPNLAPLIYDVPVCEESYVRGAVIARFVGSGAMVRLWATLYSIRESAPDRERLLVWVDDDPAPLVDVPLDDALRGTHEVFAPPFGAGASDRLAWYYPIAFSSKLIVALDGIGPLDAVYHQTNVLLDDAPHSRAPARLAARDPAIAGLARDLAGELRSTPLALSAGETAVAFDLPGPATIVALGARVPDLGVLEGVDIRISWDDAAEPAIALPLADLFAAALDAPEVDSRILRANRDASSLTLRLALPMPFTTRALVEVSSSRTTQLDLFVERSAGVPEPGTFGLLHAYRNETIGPAGASEHPVLDLGARGRLAGVCAMLEGHALADAGLSADPLNFLEGDERLVIDGVPVRGTGTEDYFDGAFYFRSGAFATPFAQAFGAASDGASGRASACRWYVGAASIDFETSVRFDLEIGPGDPSVLDRYRTVAFVYR